MEVVMGAMSTLFPKLGNLLKEEYKLQKSVRGEIKFLESELESMQVALIKVSMAQKIDQPPDVQLKLWVRDVKDLSYDVEDRIDIFMTHIHSGSNKPHSFMDFIDRSMKLLTRANIRHKIGTSIKEIKCHVKEVSERRDRYRVENVAEKPIGPTVDSLRQAALYKKATELVAIEDKSNDLVKMLMEGDDASNHDKPRVSLLLASVDWARRLLLN
ncbi:hypothetical protein PR202_ga22205 [Eleusine coracana subsp. coracana]|uniref:Disease resistance N-terminal domain-containing protein n=1 Tax=Eleusine coracana subsp. coracana TaxID=191504 RepID=A0AAV5D2Z1_ELECO|nr:hypothetical protein QOZ80_9AG0685730 [Eleusine coracana subsp. coracana]GJN04641.1 hypothetical protein PR202_ga22205 [Eleusine coracana subsp. coracana]